MDPWTHKLTLVSLFPFVPVLIFIICFFHVQEQPPPTLGLGRGGRDGEEGRERWEGEGDERAGVP